MANDNINVRFRRVETLDGITGVQGTIYFVTSTNLIYVFNGESFEPYGESAHNKVTAISSSSTHQEYPSAKAVYDVIVENEEITASALTDLDSRINGINSEVLDLDSSKLSDAPVDGKTYGRRDGDWEEMVESISSETVSEESATSQFPYVEYTEQTLTDLQKTQVRTNIDAASASEVSELEGNKENKNIIDSDISTTAVSEALVVGKTYKYMPSAGVATLAFTLTPPTETDVVEFWRFKFKSGATATEFTPPSGLYWPEGEVLIPEANTIYEVMIDEDYCVSVLAFKQVTA